MENKNFESKKSTSTDMPKNKNNESFRDKAGDLIEKAGHKISDAGAPGLGQKIHDIGDSLEDKHKNPNHPHKT